LSKILVPARSADDWQTFLAEPEKQWRTGFSARALAHCWQGSADFPPSVQSAFESSKVDAFHGLTMLLGIPEHKVPLKGGGHASQTDLFVLARTRSGDLVTIAVEGKVDETFDELVRDWLAAPQRDGTPGPTAGRKARLAYLCTCLELDEDKATELRYQLLHRTAAALIEADRFNARHALMLVHSFSPTSAWLDDYRAFARELGLEAGADEIVRVGERAGVELSIGWVRGEAAFLEA
jgi:hypothetical protein